MGVHAAAALLKMKSALLLLALAAVSAAASPEDIYKKFLRSLDVYSFRVKCWGEKNVVKLSVGIEMAKKKCMQMVDEDVPRSKRQVEELQEFQETNEEFILQFGDFQDDLSTTMGNLSCVLKAVQWLKEDGEANLEPWTTGLTDPPEGGFEFDVAHPRPHHRCSRPCCRFLQVHEQSREAPVRRGRDAGVLGEGVRTDRERDPAGARPSRGQVCSCWHRRGRPHQCRVPRGDVRRRVHVEAGRQPLDMNSLESFPLSINPSHNQLQDT